MRSEVRNIRWSKVGKFHPDTLRTERWLTRAWRMGGILEQARALNKEVLLKALDHFGHDHRDTKQAARALWRCLIVQALIKEADQIQEEYGILLKTVED